jgi:hypothetical protein
MMAKRATVTQAEQTEAALRDLVRRAGTLLAERSKFDAAYRAVRSELGALLATCRKPGEKVEVDGITAVLERDVKRVVAPERLMERVDLPTFLALIEVPEGRAEATLSKDDFLHVCEQVLADTPTLSITRAKVGAENVETVHAARVRK